MVSGSDKSAGGDLSESCTEHSARHYGKKKNTGAIISTKLPSTKHSATISGCRKCLAYHLDPIPGKGKSSGKRPNRCSSGNVQKVDIPVSDEMSKYITYEHTIWFASACQCEWLSLTAQTHPIQLFACRRGIR